VDLDGRAIDGDRGINQAGCVIHSSIPVLVGTPTSSPMVYADDGVAA